MRIIYDNLINSATGQPVELEVSEDRYDPEKVERIQTSAKEYADKLFDLLVYGDCDDD